MTIDNSTHRAEIIDEKDPGESTEPLQPSQKGVANVSDDTEPKNEGTTTAPPFETTFPEGGWRAWLVVLGSMILLGCSFGWLSSFGTFQSYYETHQLSDESPSTISWIGSTQTFTQYLIGLFSGNLFDLYGARVLIIPASIVYIFSIMMTSLCHEYYQFLLAQGILCGLATGFVFTPAISVIGHYFRRKRGLAIGVTTAGASLGGILLPIALRNALYSRTLKFPWSIRAVGFALLALMIVACAIVKERLPPRRGKMFVFEAFNIPSYSILVAAVFFSLWALWIPYYYIIVFSIEEVGMDQELAFYMLPIMNGCSMLGRIIPGYFADRFGRLNSLPIIYVLNGILLFCWARVHGTAGMIVWTGFFGFVSGAVISVYPASISSMAARPADIGAYLGQATAVVSFANLTGPPIAGALIRKHGFAAGTEFAGSAMIVAAVLSAISRYCWDRDLQKRV
ncbi:uncharacterized protein Z518_03528 [Rhinocladiella mackenziei CBS 650.93]|uniref:Major facilitator superfamily (MFS) profile domain-containing protein n=1 Tax=Rhinocladiella mackenziei CBS 650.93 TaxID=1442369 RepID=A0A0D2IZN2_9EURO|nr:uncharacterized protein Z518_03528 [Rhinocladiella mackenziei CBS 650.93]KIX08871.1 hypothetical protein Z518_03528 [Rhinocladiella mackenziei CBS 650.93]